MRVGELDELMGKYCRVISKTQEKEETFYDFGTIKFVNVEQGYILVDTKKGIKQLSIDQIFDAIPIDEFISKKFD